MARLVIFANEFVHESRRPRSAWSKSDIGGTWCGITVRVGEHELVAGAMFGNFTEAPPTCLWCVARARH